MDLTILLGELERVLARLDDAGIRHLSIAPADPAAAADRAATTGSATPTDDAPLPQGNGSELDAAPAPGELASRPASRGQRPPRFPLPAAVTQASLAPQWKGAGLALAELSTLEALQFNFRDCMACKLGATRNRLVFGTGCARPPLMFIGEGPGAEEDQQGLPFVGRAGALLAGLIAALGLTRDDVYITNVVKCRPPGNRTPEPDEIASCRPILLRQVELLDPRLIVTLGNVPLKALNPLAAGITKERGRTFAFGRWTVLPTFHPSYLLRNAAAIPTCWLDFRRAYREAYPAV